MTESVPTLNRLLTDDDDRVRAAAALSIAKIGPSARLSITPLINTSLPVTYELLVRIIDGKGNLVEAADFMSAATRYQDAIAMHECRSAKQLATVIDNLLPV